ncbi:MAG: EthD domain-containing protein [Actinomycetia bacterium]|nr:EthD domain-containing protein [Actinomycetes bacterium]
MSGPDIVQTPGAKMNYLIKRRPSTSRDELVANWFANHMPAVIAGQLAAAEKGKLHARRYVATLFDADRDGNHVWDGVAQLWWDQALPQPDQPHGTEPADTFQQKAEPYVPWATTEYVVIDGSERLPLVPNTLNPPFPCSRSGFLKVTFLVGIQGDADPTELFDHWLNVHVPNVGGVMNEVGGFHYAVSHSTEPGAGPFAGMAELYFPDADGWRRYRKTIQADGMERWVDPATTVVLRADTEMVGIA